MEKLAIVTGGNTGIGWALVRAFTAGGYATAFSWRSNPEMANNLVAEIESLGGRAKAVASDVGNQAEVADFPTASLHGSAALPTSSSTMPGSIPGHRSPNWTRRTGTPSFGPTSRAPS